MAEELDNSGKPSPYPDPKNIIADIPNDRWNEDLSYLVDTLETPDNDRSTRAEGVRMYLLPDDIPPATKRVELVWRGALTKFGFSESKLFQLQAIDSIQQEKTR